ncbi:MAG TPA: hypothetical protein VMQ86_08540 [Bryobacteraceae bacterium]|jgi:hypothetical protein|nr:hypothetical protein [Bryobacteraceae bacterium]
MTARLLLAIVLVGGMLRADLEQVKAEPNLGKRSMLALDHAFDDLTQARDAYDKGQNAQVTKFVEEIQESVLLAETSLHETGKNPRKSPKWFKRAESSTRDLLRRLDAFQHAMDVTDRPMLDAVKAKVQQVHDDLLEGVLEGKEK